MESTENMEMQAVKKSSRRGFTLIRLVTGFVIYILVPIVIIACSAFAAKRLMDSGPKAQKRAPQRSAKLVEVEEAKLSSHRVVVEAYGQVRPARTIRLQPRVSGQVIQMSREFTEGGVLKTGDMVLKLDPKDFELRIRQRTADVSRVESDLKVEQGQQTIARQEFALMKETVTDEDSDWVLRKPQLESAQAMVESAVATLHQAQLDLERTVVVAPFNAIVQTKDVEMGTQVGPSTFLGNLEGTDEYWVVATVPVNELKWLDIPRLATGTGSSARVYNEAAWGEGAYREGRIVRLLSELETEGRMARVLVAVNDPLGLEKGNEKAPQLLSGSFVRVEIEGMELGRVFALGRDVVHDEDTVWIKDKNHKLEIRPIEVVYRGQDQVFISGGLEAGESIVSTNLSSPVVGMALRTADEVESGPESAILPGGDKASEKGPVETSPGNNRATPGSGKLKGE